MYNPKHFDEPDVTVMHQLIRARPLATLVILTSDGLDANHIPLHLSATPGPYGTLRGHVARANPLWQALGKGHEALAIFHGPDAYISPSWYASKRETGKVVPTWNYAVVHAHGRLRSVDDPLWLRAHLEALTDQNEAGLPEPWAVSDAPETFTKKLIDAIVGIELEITRLTGKWKVSQNRPAQDRPTLVTALTASGQAEMAALVTARAKPR